MIDINKPIQILTSNHNIEENWLDCTIVNSYNDYVWILVGKKDPHGRILSINSERLRNKPEIDLLEKYKYFSDAELEELYNNIRKNYGSINNSGYHLSNIVSSEIYRVLKRRKERV